MNALAAFLVSIGSLFVSVQTSSAQQNPVTAIDIALEPDATMIQHAEAANARLRKVFPGGLRFRCNAPPAHHDATAVRPDG